MTEENIDPRIPIDRGWAWMVLLGSSLNMILFAGQLKNGGIIFVEIVDMIQANNSVIGWIPACLFVFMNIAGAVGTGLSVRFGQRTISMVGALFTLFGLGLNFFTSTFGLVLLFYGVFTGIGAGFLYSSSLTMVGYYFQERRAIANGITVAGASLGQLILPPIMRLLIDTFSIQGAMLLLGALGFQCLACSALFRPLTFFMRGPNPTYHRKTGESKQAESGLMGGGKIPVPDVNVNVHCHIYEDNGSDSHCSSNSIHDCEHNNKLLGTHDDKQVAKSLENLQLKTGLSPLPRRRMHTISFHDNKYNKETHLTSGNLLGVSKVMMGSSLLAIPSFQTLPNSLLTNHKENWREPKESAQTVTSCLPCINTNKENMMFDFGLLWNPVFLIIMISFCLGQFSLLSEALFLPAKAEEINIERHDAAMLMSIAAGGELFGRIGLGVIADLKLLKSPHIMAICSLGNAVAAIWCPFATNYAGLVVFAIGFGVFGGCFYGMVAVLIVDMLGIHRLNHGLGLVMLFTVFGTILGPPFQGWLKDITGTYSWSFYISGICCTMAAIILCLEPCAQRYQAKKEKIIAEEKVVSVEL